MHKKESNYNRAGQVAITKRRDIVLMVTYKSKNRYRSHGKLITWIQRRCQMCQIYLSNVKANIKICDRCRPQYKRDQQRKRYSTDLVYREYQINYQRNRRLNNRR